VIGEAVAAGASATALAGFAARSARAGLPQVIPVCPFTVDQTFPNRQEPANPITRRVLRDLLTVAWTIDTNPLGPALVMAINDELLVRESAKAHLGTALTNLAVRVASLRDGAGSMPEDDVSIPPLTPGLRAHMEDTELWRITNPTANSPFQEVETLNSLAAHMNPPAVSPNHICVPCKFDSCPGGPPGRLPPLPPSFIRPQATPSIPVVVIDSGYIDSVTAGVPSNSAHGELDRRVFSVPGYWRDPAITGSMWQKCPPDAILNVQGLPQGQPNVLDGVVGHGTFIAGIIASRSENARITVVGERRAIMNLQNGVLTPTLAAAVYADEFSVARTLARYSRAAVISCGFAFPTFSGAPMCMSGVESRSSIPFTLLMRWLTRIRRRVIVVAPAGNEYLSRPFWPAADPHVIGVAATNIGEDAPARFPFNAVGPNRSGTNWGRWLRCCCRGADVASVFIKWDGLVEDQLPPLVPQHFNGSAHWDGTSFAAPKVTAEIANILARGTPPQHAYAKLVATWHAPTNPLVGMAPPGGRVPLTNLHLN